jgi:HEAT repeat protein
MVRRRTLNTLGEIGPQAAATLPIVRGALQDSDAEVRRAAAEALENIHQPNNNLFSRASGYVAERRGPRREV